MLVMKFGGTSVANAVNINKVVDIVNLARAQDKVMLVVSALGGTTDALIECGKLAEAANELFKEKLQAIEARHLQTVKELIPVAQQSAILSEVKKQCNELEAICEGVFMLGELSPRTLDKIVSYGELMSSIIVAYKFKTLEVPYHWGDCRRLIVTNSNYTNATVNFEATNKKIGEFVNANPSPLYVLPGFIAADTNGVTTTLGRGGSDYTAAIFAAAVNASMLEIWTDVSGMMTADPRLVQNARVVPNISYQEAMELSHFGAKVIYPPTIQPVMSNGIPLKIKNTFAPQDEGTLVERKVTGSTKIISGISSMGKISLLLLEGSGMVGIPGFSKRLFDALSKEKINVILITQSSSEHSICVAIDEANAARAKEAVDAEFDHELSVKKLEPLGIETGLAIIAVVGDNMKNHPGISGRMFGALGRNGVNIRAIAQGSSEKNISAVIGSADVKKAINVLHEEFFETTYKQLNLFIAGAGNVGSRLLQQLKQQYSYLQQNLRLQVRVVAIANSKKAAINEEGLDLSAWDSALANAPQMKLDGLVDFIRQKNLRNSVFVDNTASAEVAATYRELLPKSVAVIACNKIACSSEYKNYEQLKQLAREFNTSFLFETNVGAGLPVIGTLNDLLRSGDEIKRIEAVLSGTLNFVFNNYDGAKPFATVVKQAQDEGYTEPDPRLDLGGTDVMRKILILAREAGYKMEMDDIANDVFLPTPCMKGDVANFYKELEKHEAHFKKLYTDAAAKDCKLKFVARLNEGKASVGLQHINKEHDFYHLYGKDNVVLFYTRRYDEQPLVVKGAGAGADVTASGVFADIIRAARV
ncbi:MAG TPA: bifunctional aspartate kinase/homoserine dehydrogenase I [Chitinophagales bacterium]|nr:bifunctional aspartate kinase/homoserine dehydrogenase I [Chitinophagales bacterium]